MIGNVTRELPRNELRQSSPIGRDERVRTEVVQVVRVAACPRVRNVRTFSAARSRAVNTGICTARLPSSTVAIMGGSRRGSSQLIENETPSVAWPRRDSDRQVTTGKTRLDGFSFTILGTETTTRRAAGVERACSTQTRRTGLPATTEPSKSRESRALPSTKCMIAPPLKAMRCPMRACATRSSASCPKMTARSSSAGSTRTSCCAGRARTDVSVGVSRRGRFFGVTMSPPA